ncbi:uncharacterized protein BDW70DRAFT_162605 [Aspergillus foveolatus]|uniref:uncharacterized protein n=1 Tax=Aspergillus foveolatus TaxID=210207 RepID=UPI003CCCCF4A
MAEFKGHDSKAFFRNTLHALPKTLKRNICPRSRRNLSDTNSVMQSRPTSVPVTEYSNISSYESRRPRSTRIASAPQHRCLTKPENTDHEDHKHKREHEHTREPEAQSEIEHDVNISQPTGVTKGFRIRRLNSRPHSLQLPRTQFTTLNGRFTFPPSRLPTPTGPPKNARYSHSVYEREGRRSVLSPIGRRWAMQTPVTTRSKLQRPSTQTTAVSRQLSSSFRVVRRPLAQYDDSNTTSEVTVPASATALAHTEKERGSDNNHHLLLYYKIHNRLSFFDAASIETTRPAMTSPKRLRLTQGFADLRAQETLQTKIPTLQQIRTHSSRKPTSQLQNPHLQRHSYEYIKENDAPTAQRARLQPAAYQPQHANVEMTPKSSKEPVSQLPVLSPTSSRRKLQHEKMVLALFPARSSHQTPISPVPSRASNPKRRPVLTPQMVGRPQVETAMPQEYWLGRFMTLTNAFHYEDSFNEPDIATGFEMPSSYSRPFQGSDDGDMAAYRVKRAFMVLENRCFGLWAVHF